MQGENRKKSSCRMRKASVQNVLVDQSAALRGLRGRMIEGGGKSNVLARQRYDPTNWWSSPCIYYERSVVVDGSSNQLQRLLLRKGSNGLKGLPKSVWN